MLLLFIHFEVAKQDPSLLELVGHWSATRMLVLKVVLLLASLFSNLI